MEKNTSMLFIGVLIAGFFIGYLFGNSSITSSNIHKMPDGTMMANDHAHDSMEEMMHEMSDSLVGKTGGDFDKEFLTQMIVHHQGAVEMAEMVLKQSNRPELIQLAKDIISAQNKEIKMMQDWNVSWFNSLPPVPVTDNQISPPNTGAVACTMEAKICPDGSAVGRQGPNCEFAKCPGV